jgi:hypothetical protein
VVPAQVSIPCILHNGFRKLCLINILANEGIFYSSIGFAASFVVAERHLLIASFVTEMNVTALRLKHPTSSFSVFDIH